MSCTSPSATSAFSCVSTRRKQAQGKQQIQLTGRTGEEEAVLDAAVRDVLPQARPERRERHRGGGGGGGAEPPAQGGEEQPGGDGQEERARYEQIDLCFKTLLHQNASKSCESTQKTCKLHAIERTRSPLEIGRKMGDFPGLTLVYGHDRAEVVDVLEISISSEKRMLLHLVYRVAKNTWESLANVLLNNAQVQGQKSAITTCK